MRPYQHARSVAEKLGTNWRDDLAIHEFVDSSKFVVPDMRHRLFLHSIDLGGTLASWAFPDRQDVEQIVACHITEDLGHIRTLRDWLEHVNVAHLPKMYPCALPLDRQTLILREASLCGLADHTLPDRVFDILSLPALLAPKHELAAWCILANSLGPWVVRQIIGPPFEIEGGLGKTVVFDPALTAERIIYALFRCVPEARTVAMALRTSHRHGGV